MTNILPLDSLYRCRVSQIDLDIMLAINEASLLGGPWDLVTAYTWTHNLTDNFPQWGTSTISRVIIPVISSY